ncbi:MAG: hypothetical protein K2O40_10385 [Lachnospiraceae bacterium]|nr:hypothetical protein [Lachnospiraceae bacterium]
MFQTGLQERIQLLEPELVEVSDTCLHLTEKGDGQADLMIQLRTQCILIRKLEKNKLEYFLNKKCADYVLLEHTVKGWIAHIFEMKRTIKTDTWEAEIKKQFHGAMQNLLAFSGVLGIEIQDIVLHTVYRNDKINDMANPVKQHLTTHCKDRKRTDWNDRNITLNFLDRTHFRHDKIKLDLETGEGAYSLCNEV